MTDTPTPEPILSANGWDKTQTYGLFKPRIGSVHYGRMLGVNWDIVDAALDTIDAKLAQMDNQITSLSLSIILLKDLCDAQDAKLDDILRASADMDAFPKSKPDPA